MGSLFRTLLKIYRWTATVVQGSCRLSRSFVLAMPAISVDAESRLYWWHFTVIPYSAGPWPWLHVSGQRPPPTPHYYSCTNYHKTLSKKPLHLTKFQRSFCITQCHIRKSTYNLHDPPLHIQDEQKTFTYLRCRPWSSIASITFIHLCLLITISLHCVFSSYSKKNSSCIPKFQSNFCITQCRLRRSYNPDGPPLHIQCGWKNVDVSVLQTLVPMASITFLQLCLVIATSHH